MSILDSSYLGVSRFWSVSDLKLLLSLDSSFSPSSIYEKKTIC